MAVYFDPNIKRYRDDANGQFASTDTVAEAIRDGFDRVDRPVNSSDPATISVLRSIEAQIKALNRTTKAQVEQQKAQRSVLTSIARSSRSLRSSLNSYEMAIALVATIAVCLYANLSDPSESVINKMLGTDFQAQIEEGDSIAGYKITSGFGHREAPLPGASTNHKGVDAATPVGTTLYMVGDRGTVECKSDPNGFGTYAVIRVEFGGGVHEFLAAHLSRCQSGEYKGGQIYAKTGNTGNSTAAHLHWEEWKSGQPVPPTKGWLIWSLTGNNVLGDGGSSGNGDRDDLRLRILRQESGGDAQAVNVDSGALGKYQVMPENVAPWSQECLGRSLSQAEFMAQPALQDRIADCKLGQAFTQAKESGESDFEACRSTAAIWYSGDASLKNSTVPQNGYPSIRSYTEQVCNGF